MVESIELNLNINNKEEKVIIDGKALTVTSSNGITKHISRGVILKLLSFVKSWKDSYDDGEKNNDTALMIFNYGDTTKTYDYKGAFPKNFHAFVSFIDAIR